MKALQARVAVRYSGAASGTEQTWTRFSVVSKRKSASVTARADEDMIPVRAATAKELLRSLVLAFIGILSWVGESGEPGGAPGKGAAFMRRGLSAPDLPTSSLPAGSGPPGCGHRQQDGTGRDPFATRDWFAKPALIGTLPVGHAAGAPVRAPAAGLPALRR